MQALIKVAMKIKKEELEEKNDCHAKHFNERKTLLDWLDQFQ